MLSEIMFVEPLDWVDYIILYPMGILLILALFIPVIATFKVIYMYSSDKYLFKELDTNSLGERMKNTLIGQLGKIIGSTIIAIIVIVGIIIISKILDIEYYKLFKLIILSKAQLIKIVIISLIYGVITFLYTGYYQELIKIIIGDKKFTIGCISYKYENVEDYLWEDNTLIVKIKTGRDTSNMSTNVSNISVFEIEIPSHRKDILENHLSRFVSIYY